MIISHSHKLVFIKSLKTAGTSVEAALSKSCGDSDVVTSLGDYKFNRDQQGKWVHHAMNEVGFHQHDDAETIRSRMPNEAWNAYFKVSIVRNPWDRALSYFFWDKRRDPSIRPRKRFYHYLGVPLHDFKIVKENFTRFIKAGTLENNDRFYIIDDELCTDFVIRYERLEEDYKNLCERLSLPVTDLPHLKTGIRQTGRHFTEYYDDETRDIVAALHRNDLRFFDYKFEQ